MEKQRCILYSCELRGGEELKDERNKAGNRFLNVKNCVMSNLKDGVHAWIVSVGT